MQRDDSEPIVIGDFELIAIKVGGDMLIKCCLGALFLYGKSK